MAISIDVTTFDLGHVNDLNDDDVVEVDVEGALKLSIFIVQKAAAPKSGVEFRQDSIGAIRSCLATSYDVSRRRARSPNFETFLKFVTNHPTTNLSLDASLLKHENYF